MTPSERMKNDMKAAKIKSFKRQVTQDMTKTAKQYRHKQPMQNSMNKLGNPSVASKNNSNTATSQVKSNSDLVVR